MSFFSTPRLIAIAGLGFMTLNLAAFSTINGCARAAAPVAATAPAAQDFGRFSVEVTGTGPDVILIPGLTSSREVWRPFVEANKGKYRFHMIQVAGFAGAPAGPNAAGEVVAPTAEAIDAYIKAKGLVAPAVIGHSLGGEAALMLAARHPGDVGKVLIVDSLPFISVLFFGPTATVASVTPMADAMRDRTIAQSKAEYDAAEGAFLANLAKTEAARPALVQQAVDSDHGVVARAMHDLLVTDLRPELPNITVPVTVLYPYDASYAAKGLTQPVVDGLYTSMYAGLKGVKMVRVDDSFHFIMIDQPARFQAEASAFLGG